MERPGISFDKTPPFLQFDQSNVPGTKEELLADEQSVENLKLIAKQTWLFLYKYLDATTGLPVDRVDINESKKISSAVTSPTNIGMALLSLGTAEDLSLTDKGEAETTAAKIVNTLQDMEKKFGLFLNWCHPESGETVKQWPGTEKDLDMFLSSVDNAWIAAGLLFTREKFPSLTAQISPILEEMDFSLFHSPELNSFSGGCFSETQELAQWQYDLKYLSESRILYYVSYLLGHISEAQLQELFNDFPLETYGGTAFEALMPGLIFDESLVANKAIRSMLISQIEAGKVHGMWGFSPCVDGDGTYKEFGTGYYAKNGFDVVALHAIFLALEHNPDLSLSILTQLVNELDVWGEYGFYDSADVSQRKSSKTLLYLDQAMIFLAVANLLNGDSVRETFSGLMADAGYEE